MSYSNKHINRAWSQKQISQKTSSFLSVVSEAKSPAGSIQFTKALPPCTQGVLRYIHIILTKCLFLAAQFIFVTSTQNVKSKESMSSFASLILLL